MTHTEQRAQLIRGCFILLALIICLFLWLSILTFDETDAPNPHVWRAHPERAQNGGGLAGAWLAFHLFDYFGKGAYAITIGMTLAIIVLARQGRLPSIWQRIIGIALLVIVTSCIAHILTDSGAARWPYRRGGVLGYFVAEWLQQSLKWMSVPILLYGVVVGLLFTGEELFFKVPGALRRRGAQLQTAVATAAPAAGRVTSGIFGRFLAKLPSLRAQAAGESGTHRGRKAASSAVRERPPSRMPARTEPEEDEEKLAEDEYEEEDEDEYEYDDESDDEEEDDDDEYDDEAEEDEEEAAADEAGEDSQGAELELDEPLAPEPKMVVNFPTPPLNRTALPIPAKPYPVELSEWEFPQIDLLEEPEYHFTSQQEALVREKARELEQTLQEFKVDARVVEIDTGPVITMFGLQVAPGVKVGQINALANDIARSLCAPSVRVVAPIPGKSTVGIEVPNVDKEKVRLRELMTIAGDRTQSMALPLFLGKDASGGALIGDLAKMPHMLIAGTTGSGKSVCINSIIMSLLMTQRPDMVKLILVDPKMVEMSAFREVPHLMCPIVTEMERAEKILEWATVKMDERYALLAEAGVRNITAYNRLTKEEKIERFQPSNEDEAQQIPTHLPYVVILIDELADMMMLSAKEVELHLSRLAQKSRAVGIHIIVATQRPEAKIVTGLIKSNLPCRIAFRVASRMDSRIVLDQNGAEVLMGQGDMLYLPPGSAKLVRAQGTYLEDAELKDVITDLKAKGNPEFHPELMQLGRQEISADGPRDELFDQAVEVVLQSRRGSVSLLQRRLTIGYSRASRLVEEMAAAGIVGEYKGSQAREVLLTQEEWQALKEQEASRIREAALSDDGVPDDMFDDDI